MDWWMNEWMDSWTDGRIREMDGWMEGWMNGWTNMRTNEWIDVRWSLGRMDGRKVQRSETTIRNPTCDWLLPETSSKFWFLWSEAETDGVQDGESMTSFKARKAASKLSVRSVRIQILKISKNLKGKNILKIIFVYCFFYFIANYFQNKTLKML